jgi:signal transduction histidine kinase
MLVPLAFDGKSPLAVMTLFAVDRARRWSEEDLEAALDLGARAAFAIEHARLERAREDTLSVLSHDLRNPLNVITVATASLSRGAVASERVSSYLDKMRRAAERMNRLIQDVVDASRLEAGKVELDRTAQPVDALVAAAIELARPLAEAKEITLRADVAAGLPATLVDHDRVLQLFGNLLGNAIKFTPKGGAVTLSAARDAHDIRFDVVDTGVGIGPEHLPRLFDRHFQAERTDREGAGLGLAIARRITLAHDGRISVDSELGKGAAFHVLALRLPDLFMPIVVPAG